MPTTATDPRASFFPKRRVRMELSDWKPKMNSQDEKRIRLDFMLPLTDDNRDGMLPEWAFHPLSAMEREDSVEKSSTLDVTLEGITLELFDVKTSASRCMLLTAATLQDFELKRVTRDKQTFLALTFNTNIKRDWNMLKWADKYESCYLWCECTPVDPDKATVPAPGVQMNITDAGASHHESEQTEDEARANATEFFQTPEAKEAVEESPVGQLAQELSAAPAGRPTPKGFDPTDKPKRAAVARKLN